MRCRCDKNNDQKLECVVQEVIASWLLSRMGSKFIVRYACTKPHILLQHSMRSGLVLVLTCPDSLLPGAMDSVLHRRIVASMSIW